MECQKRKLFFLDAFERKEAASIETASSYFLPSQLIT
jgi:hypothetical protein